MRPQSLRFDRLITGLAFCLAVVSWLPAQEASPPAETPEAPPAAESTAGGAPPAADPAAAASAAAVESGETTAPGGASTGPKEIYLPFKFLKGIFDSQGASVVVPLDEYQRLKAAADKTPAPAVSMPAVITTGSYTATIEQDLARIRAELTVNVLGTPWIEVPLRFGAAAIGKIEAGEKVLLKGNGDGNYSLLLGTAGEQKITLELTARVHTSPEGRSFDFEVPATGITTFEILIPEADQTVEVQPRLISIPVDAAEKQTRVKASLGATPKISAHWRPKATSKPEMELLSSVVNYTRVGVEDGLIHTDTILEYEVLRGEVEQIRVSVPTGHRILDVSAESRLKGWQAKEDGERQIVTIDLLGRQSGKFNVEIHTQRKLPDEPFDVAGATDAGSVGIHALDVVRESGQVCLQHSSDLAITIEALQGVVRIDANELHERLRGERVTSFKYYSPNFVLKASAKPVEPRLLVDQQAQLVFVDDELRLNTILQYTIERSGLFQLNLSLPEGVVIDHVECPQMKDFVVDPGTHQLTVNLTDRTTGNVPLTIRAHVSYTAGEATTELVLPVLEPRGVERDTGSLYVFARESIEVTTQEAGLVSAQPLPIVPGSAVGEAMANSAWSYTRRPVTIPVKTTRKPTRIEAATATTIDLQAELSEVTTRLDYLVQYAAVDTFRFLVPESVSSQVQIESEATYNHSPGIKQKLPSPAKDGWVEWTVVMQREVLGIQRFRISYDVKPVQSATGSRDRQVTVQVVKPLGYVKGEQQTPLSQSTGEITMTRDESLAVSVKATGGDIEPIDIRELTLLPQTGTQAFRFYTQPDNGAVQVDISQTKYEIEEVVETVVSKALVQIVTGETSAATYLALLRVKTSERQRLLVHLPKGLEPLNISVAGRVVSLEQADFPSDQKLGDGWETYWLNVARESGSDQEFTISLHFQWNVNPSLGGSNYGRGTLDLPLPVIGRKDSVPVQQLRTVVYVPEKFSLVGSPVGFVNPERIRPWRAFWWGYRPSAPSSLEWFGDGGIGELLPTQGRVGYTYTNMGGVTQITVTWWNRVFMATLFSLAAAGVAILLVKTSLENKLSMLALGVFIAVLYGLKDSQALAQTLLSARYGLFFLLGLWTIRTVFGKRTIAATVIAAAPLGASAEAPLSVTPAASASSPQDLIDPPSPESPPSSPTDSDGSNGSSASHS